MNSFFVFCYFSIVLNAAVVGLLLFVHQARRLNRIATSTAMHQKARCQDSLSFHDVVHLPTRCAQHSFFQRLSRALAPFPSRSQANQPILHVTGSPQLMPQPPPPRPHTTHVATHTYSRIPKYRPTQKCRHSHPIHTQSHTHVRTRTHAHTHTRMQK